MIKKWISILAAATLCFGVAVFAACDNDDGSSSSESSSSVESSSVAESSESEGSNESSSATSNAADEAWANVDISNGYAIRVTYENGEVAANVKVQICDTTGQCSLPKRTDANGITIVTPPSGTPESCHVELNSLPEGYTYDQNIYTSAAGYEKIVVVLTPAA